MKSTMPNVLVVEGNTRAGCARMAAVGSPPYAPYYASLLQQLLPGVTCTCVCPAEDGPHCLPAGDALENYDGAVWTGSALSVYEAVPAVQHQRKLAENVLGAGLSVFGSCWGLQVFTEVLGGRVAKNPRGWEVGYAAEIELTDAGQVHPMYAGKRGPFGAFAVHQDEVVDVAPGGAVLAHNAMSAVQAWAWEGGGATFWGVQYHPEFNHQLMAWTFRRLAPKLVADGVFSEEKTVSCLVSSLESPDEYQPPYASPDVADLLLRTREIRNWLESLRGR